MLVLSRHRDEAIVIDLREFGQGLVEVILVDIRGDKARIGISAGGDVPVHRREIFDAIEAEKNPAA